jgi:mono/diheme cytochrome c family protein
MLPVFLFVAFWVVVAGGLFAVANRGGRGAERAGRPRSTARRRFSNVILVFVYVGFGLALPAVMLIGNANRSSAQVGGLKLTANEKAGRELFGVHCSVCHTLAATNAVGKTGPNLDTLKPSESEILHTLANGCLQDPPTPTSPQTCLGYGTMPANIVEGVQAQQVASFVARVAGQE